MDNINKQLESFLYNRVGETFEPLKNTYNQSTDVLFEKLEIYVNNAHSPTEVENVQKFIEKIKPIVSEANPGLLLIAENIQATAQKKLNESQEEHYKIIIEHFMRYPNPEKELKQHMKEVGITGPKLFPFLVACAKSAPSKILFSLIETHHSSLDTKDAFDLVILSIQRNHCIDTAYIAKNSQIFPFNLEQRYLIAKELCSVSPYALLYEIINLGLSEEQSYSFAKQIAENKPEIIDTLINKINNFSLSQENKLDIAILIAKHQGKPLEVLIKNVRKFSFSSAQSLALATFIAENNSRQDTAKLIRNLKGFLLEPDDLCTFAITVVQKHKTLIKLFLCNFDPLSATVEKRYVLASAIAQEGKECIEVLFDHINMFSLPSNLITSLLETCITKLIAQNSAKEPLDSYAKLSKYILSYKNTELKTQMVILLFSMLENQAQRNAWRAICDKKDYSSYLLLAFFPGALLPNEENTRLISDRLLQKTFKDHAKNAILLQCLGAILSTNNDLLSNEEKLGLICNVLLKDKSPEKILKRSMIIYTLLQMNDIQKVKDTLEKRADLPSLEELIESIFSISGDKMTRYFEKFHRRPEAPIIYATKLRQLTIEEQERCIPLFNLFLQSTLDETFPGVRYQKVDNPHLQMALTDAVEEKWRKGASYDISDIFPDSALLPKNSKHFLQEKIFREGRIHESDTPILAQVLKDELPIEEAQNLLLSLLSSKCSAMLLFEQAALNFLSNSALDLETLKNMTLALERASPTSLLINDLKDLKKTLETKKALASCNLASCKIIDTDDPLLLFMMGTDVEGSCQRIDSDPSLNKCLLAYLMDGKNRLLAIVDQDNRIVARAVLRLLLNEENKPVLFLERAYFAANYPDELKQLLENAAIRRASELGLPLNPKGVLRSLASPAPFEYVDSGGVLLANGSWELKNN